MKTNSQRKTSILTCFLCFCSFWTLIFLGGCESPTIPQGIVLNVERVVSGQTLEVIEPQKQPALISRVQLIGVEAPDLRQRPWGEAARDRLQELIGSKPVLLESDLEPKDQFERQLAYVWVDGKLLNEQLLLEGYGIFRPRSLNNKYDQRLERAQEYARVMGLGIWDSEKPLRVRPEEFRQQYR